MKMFHRGPRVIRWRRPGKHTLDTTLTKETRCSVTAGCSLRREEEFSKAFPGCVTETVKREVASDRAKAVLNEIERMS